MSDQLERVVRRIVEGQIRGFLKEHPSIVEAVDWYKPRRDDKATTFTNSLAKRIVLDLVCPTTRARLVAALLASSTEAQSESTVASSTAATDGSAGTPTDRSDAAPESLIPDDGMCCPLCGKDMTIRAGQVYDCNRSVCAYWRMSA